ncbi:hypothetical protein AAE478_010064 [Parahypoxylon ruwenzoriense]
MKLKGSWGSLPAEMRLEILSLLPGRGSSAYASVCDEWRTVIERANFRRLTLTQSCLASFAELHRAEARRAIKHICLRIKLETYGCPDCENIEGVKKRHRNNKVITTAIWRLFSILGSWTRTDSEGLTLEMEVYSASDSKHYFKHLVFGDNEPDLTRVRTSRRHGWINGQLTVRPPCCSILRLFEYVDLSFDQVAQGADLATNQVIIRFLIRRQTRRRFGPACLAKLVSRCSRLEDIHYEHWGYWSKAEQETNDQKLENFLLSHLPHGLRAMTLFEDSNEDYIPDFQDLTPGFPMVDTKTQRIPRPATGAALAQVATNLERLSASFNVDAESFFQAALTQRFQSTTWDRLETLVLTSRLLDPGKASTQHGARALNEMLLSAAATAQMMPKLCLLAIWHGARGSACLFRYHRRPYSCSIQLKGTWLPTLVPSVLQAWTKVARVQTDSKVELEIEYQTISIPIDSHGTAAHYLGLTSLVAHPVSLRQIRREAESIIV